MGMTIEEVNERLYDIKTDAIYQITSEEKEAIDVAISTMRKYEKIEQILKDIPYGGEATVRRIQEVIEDGSENNHHASNT